VEIESTGLMPVFGGLILFALGGCLWILGSLLTWWNLRHQERLIETLRRMYCSSDGLGNLQVRRGASPPQQIVLGRR
jgi:hypothetical protein